MPELPEVETMRRGLLPLVGGVIVEAFCPSSNHHPIKYSPPADKLFAMLVGRRITAVERCGKRLLLRLDNDYILIIEPRMTGRVELDPPQFPSHVRLVLRVVLNLENPKRLAHPIERTMVFRDVRGLGIVRLLDASACPRELGPHKIGPDAMEVSWQELRDRLAHRTCAIKVALLDQKALAGVGNIYASESLHLARIHPTTPCCEIKNRQWQRLHEALQRVLTEAIANMGSTLSDGAYATPENESGRYQNLLRVYQRTGQRCLQCRRGMIRRMVLNQRSTFYCPVCQRKPTRYR
ncbi:MAG: bifunctional DNA-formamidopyrimidine glycosylase/DNA-(apurinic or apyrimidinic site) lyase [Thermogutta sp.]